MQREIVPTSPQYQGADKPRPEASRPKYRLGLWEIIVILVFSFVGGVCASLIINNQIILKDTIAKEIVYLSEKRNGQDASFSDAVKKIVPSVLGVYDNKDTFLGSALILTSDGWLVSTLDDVNLPQAKIKTSDDKEYQIDQMILDDYSGATFIKINAMNLMPAQFSSPEQTALGDISISVFNSPFSGERVFISHLENLTYHEAETFQTQNYPYDYLLNDTLKPEYESAAVINDKGEVLGFNLSEGKILPHRYVSKIMGQIIAGQKIERIDFSLEYNLLSDKGAEIKKIITANTGLLIGDIILKVEGQDINKLHNFNHILEEYKAGDTATFTIKRGEEEKEIVVTL